MTPIPVVPGLDRRSDGARRQVAKMVVDGPAQPLQRLLGAAHHVCWRAHPVVRPALVSHVYGMEFGEAAFLRLLQRALFQRYGSEYVVEFAAREQVS